MINYQQTIEEIRKRIRSGAAKYNFNSSIDRVAIELFEKAFGIDLPE